MRHSLVCVTCGCRGRDSYDEKSRAGARDADTSFSVSMTLYLLLRKAGIDADYALIWDAPHGEADYPGEIRDWINRICEGKEA